VPVFFLGDKIIDSSIYHHESSVMRDREVEKERVFQKLYFQGCAFAAELSMLLAASLAMPAAELAV